jgi:outer membrane protein TolC
MPDRRLPLLLSTLCLFPALVSIAQEGGIPLDLPTAMTLAARHNPQVRMAQERIQEQEGVLVEIQSGRRPRLDASASYQFTDKDRIESFGDFPQNNETYAADVTARYTVYAGGGRQAAEKGSSYTLEAASQQVEAVLSGVLLTTGVHYFDALLAREQASAQLAAIAVFEKQREWAEKRFKAGAGPELDVLRAEVAIANARPPLIRARNDEKIAEERLLEVIGLELAKKIPDPFELEVKWPEARPRLELEEYEERALDSRPEFQVLKLNALAALEQVKTARSLGRPQLDVFANYGASGQRFREDFGSPLDGYSFGAQATWALWDAGLKRGREMQAESRIRQKDIEKVMLDLEIAREVHVAWLGCQEAAEIRTTADTVVRQASEVLRQAEARFQAGAATQLDVLEAQWELTRARLERIQASYTANVALLRLEQASGLLASP